MSDHDLEELLGRIPVPAYDVRDDVARGTGRLRRRNVSLSATGLVLTATVGTALLLQGSGGPAAAPPYAGGPASPSASTTTPAPTLSVPPRPDPRKSARTAFTVPGPRASYALLRQWRDVLGEHLGEQVRFAQNQQSGGGSLGSKYDWAGGGMLELMVGSRWDDIAGFVGVAGSQRITFQGLAARTWTDGSDLLVSVRHEDGTVVSLYASTSFGNNGTSTDALGLTEHDLLDAAADPRLRLPSR